MDEAHVIHEWGFDFRPHYGSLGRVRLLFPGAPVLALTATANESTQQRIRDCLGLSDCVMKRLPVIRTRLYLHRRSVNAGFVERIKDLVTYIQKRPEDLGIVYCLSRRQVDEVTAKLKAMGIKARAYHAGMTAQQRQWAQNAFMRNRCKVMVATIAFGLGIHKPAIRYVVHLGLPRSIQGYLQEIGRAGRDGKAADCLLLYAPEDVEVHRKWIRKDDLLQRAEAVLADMPRDPQKHERLHEREKDIQEMLDFARTTQCLHQCYAAHFHEEVNPCAEWCENCLDEEGRVIADMLSELDMEGTSCEESPK